MNKPDYHNELTSIVKGLRNRLMQEETPSEFLELEFKHGYLKGPKQFKQDLNLESESYNGPILLNFSEKYKKIKVNANCVSPFFENANANLQAFAKETNCRVEEKFILNLNCMEQRYFYDCSEDKWAHANKVRIFPQCNVMHQNKFYRINCSSKEIHEGAKDLVQQLRLNGWRASKGYLRFKHSTIYHVDAHYSIECNTIYESQSESQYLPIQKAIQNLSNLSSIVKQKLYEKKSQTKDELELKFSTKGIEYLVYGSFAASKRLFSEAFNQLRDITNQPQESYLAKMMENLSIETKQKRRQEKVQKRQTVNQIPQPRREFRKRQA